MAITALNGTTLADDTSPYRDSGTRDHFVGVYFEDWWKLDEPSNGLSGFAVRPYASKIQPYLPVQAQGLVKRCQGMYEKYSKEGSFNENGSRFYFCRDPLRNVFRDLSPQDLASFSEVSSCCYLVTKIEIIWEDQLKKLLPKTCIIPQTKSCFSSEEQFKIIFKTIQEVRRPYDIQFKKNEARLCKLRGPSGMDGKIDKAWRHFQDLGGEAARKKYNELLDVNFMEKMRARSELENTHESQVSAGFNKYCSLNRQRIMLGGATYNGTRESFSSESQQMLCLRAIESMLSGFNEQAKFEAVIQTAEAIKNNTSQIGNELKFGLISLANAREISSNFYWIPS
jgi:hypothetical protein